MGNYQLAVDDLLVAIDIQPNVGMYWHNLGIEYRNLEQYENSIDAFTQSLQLRPNQANTYHSRAITYSRMGDDDNFESDLARACELGYDAPGACPD